MSDFGVEHSFAQAAARLREHYGIEVAVGAVARITEEHAQAAASFVEAFAASAPRPAQQSAVAQLICEMDGSMVPIVVVEKPSPQADGRKHRQSVWKEARLCAAVAQGSVTATYAVSFEGTAHAGSALASAARVAGLGEETKIHAVGDGAPWIAAEIDHQFGAQATYLIDFYHVSEYLAAAAHRACPENPALWRRNQQEALKAGRLEAVLAELKSIPGQGSPGETPPQDDPVAGCIRYLEKRRSHLDYRAALQAGLPIGSGLIESGHRHILQARLKRPGAWWRWDNAKAMANLRVLRQNGLWDAYWTHRAVA
jgi:hypothetical protein